MEHVTVEARRRRWGLRHHLAARARGGGAAAIAGDLVGLHATDPATIYLSVRARDPATSAEDIDAALYEDRTVVRMLAMRRTMFVVPIALAPVLQRSSSDAVAVKQHKLALDLVRDGGLSSDPNRWFRRVEQATLAALQERGSASAAELREAVPALQKSVVVAPGKNYEATVNMTSRTLNVLAAQGHIVRGRPSGSWVSTQYRWYSLDAWSADLAAVLSADALPSVADAQVELVRRWLATFGPGTLADVKWWTGWTAREVRAALATIQPDEVDLGGATGFVLPGDLAPDDPSGNDDAPWVALLPALDPATMGWTERDWYLGPHRPLVFDRSGNAGPTIWSDGRVVGGWAYGPDGTVRVRILEDVGREVHDAVDREAGEVEAWLGGRRFRVRFRSPLENELVA
ncbi:MAG: AlkZ family DNA glycosylase [Acidimicrobiia bacterium]|nr:AlkZ family DNA glycosylase [Acidimicrobiia bacterium]